MDITAERIAGIIAAEIGARPAQVSAAAELLDGGATVPISLPRASSREDGCP
jgi:protein Tex